MWRQSVNDSSKNIYEQRWIKTSRGTVTMKREWQDQEQKQEERLLLSRLTVERPCIMSRSAWRHLRHCRCWICEYQPPHWLSLHWCSGESYFAATDRLRWRGVVLGLQRYRLESVSIYCETWSAEVKRRDCRPSSRWQQFVCRRRTSSARPAEVSPIQRIGRILRLSIGQEVFLLQHLANLWESRHRRIRSKGVPTDYIVPKLIPDQRLKWALPFFVQYRQNIDNLLPLLGRPELNALLHHVARKLMLGQVH